MISDLTSTWTPFTVKALIHPLRPFSPFDFETFPDLEAHEPLIGMVELPDGSGHTVIVDNCVVHVMDMADNEWVSDCPSVHSARIQAERTLMCLAQGDDMGTEIAPDNDFTLV